MLKIAHIITGLSADGAERMLQRIVGQMDPARFCNEIVSLTTTGELGGEFSRAGLRVTAVGMEKSAKGLLGFHRLWGVLRKSRPHIVQTWMYHADMAGSLAAKANRARVPVVWGIHHASLDRNTNKWSTVATARMCGLLSGVIPARIICCSRAARDVHVNVGYSPHKITVIPNGFDTGNFRPNEAKRLTFRRGLGVGADAVLVGMAARFHSHKDHETFIAAARALARRNKKVQFVLCGNGVNWTNPELVSWIRDADLQGRIHLLGEQKETASFFCGIDIATSSSRTEAFPLAVGEAMSTGIPCVVTDVGDSAYLVGGTGVVVEPMNWEALSDGWERLIQLDRKALAALGVLARNRIKSEFSLAATTRKYEEVYTRLAQDRYQRQELLEAEKHVPDCSSAEPL